MLLTRQPFFAVVHRIMIRVCMHSYQLWHFRIGTILLVGSRHSFLALHITLGAELEQSRLVLEQI